MRTDPNSASPRDTRREFLKATSASAAGLSATLAGMNMVHAAGTETLRVGLVGCGGRGNGAAVQALTADPNTRLVAVGDAFSDQLEKSLAALSKTAVADRAQVDHEHRFVGFDAYKHVINACDIVLLATPPHFRPMHLKYAVEQGKHSFVEKPVAVDAPGVQSILATCEEAKKKNLMVVSGLCWRYETGMKAIIDQIHAGRIGDIVALETTRYGGGAGKLAKRQPHWTDMEYQMRNWYFHTWLSGDFIVEQFVHELDKMAWVMQDEYPVSCAANGGRQVRVAPEYGHIYDHFNAIYEYANGVKLYAGTRHEDGTSSLRLDLAHGDKGRANLMRYSIEGADPWRHRGRMTQMHQLEHDAMYRALRAGEIINNGDYMAKSTMMAIIARMSAYTGKTLTWDQAMQSAENLSPPAYDWNVRLPDPPVAMPGLTPFV